MKLYEIPDALRAIDDMIEDNGGEVTDGMIAAIDSLELTIAEKFDGCAALICEKEQFADAAAEEAQRLMKLAASRRKTAERVRKYLLEVLARAGRTKVEGLRFVVRVQRNGQPTIRWAGGDKVPADFARVTVEPDLAKARQALRDDGQLPDGFTVEHGSHLRIV